jgi:F-box interacting protein
MLPEELISEILSFLPVKPLLRFQCVSKPWFALINDPYVMKLHRTIIVEGASGHNDFYLVNFSRDDRLGEAVNIKQPLEHRPRVIVGAHIVGSCNGLVCISNSDHKIAIWNPLIRKHRKLPSPQFGCGYDISAIGWGYDTAFGYDGVNNDYKVIRISRKLYQIELYSMRGNSWRKVKEEWPLTEESSSIFGYPSFSNGAVHWMVTFVDHRMVATLKIVAFDLSTEKFRVHAPPDPFLYEGPAKLNVLRGCLCFCIHNQVWVMEEYGKPNSWTLLYKLRRSFSFCESYVFSHNGEEVLTSALNDKRSSFEFFWYDIKKKTSRIVNIQNILPTAFRTIICQGSLLLP